MDGVLVAGAVAKNEAIPLPVLHHERIDVRPRFVVNRPCIELRSLQGAAVAEGKRKGFVRLCGGSGVGELNIVPLLRRWILPDRITLFSGIFSNYAEAHLTGLLLG